MYLLHQAAAALVTFDSGTYLLYAMGQMGKALAGAAVEQQLCFTLVAVRANKSVADLQNGGRGPSKG